MANIKDKIAQIRQAIFGKEVRESIASGIEAINEEVENTTARQDNVEAQFQAVLDETTDKDVISAPEITAARVGADNTTYSNLKTRLDTEHQQVMSQLADEVLRLQTDIVSLNNSKIDKSEAATKQELQQGLAAKADQAFVDAQFASIVSGAPRGVYNTVTELKQAYPNGTEGVFLVLEDGYVYYWNAVESNWLSAGEYRQQPLGEYMFDQDEEWVI